MPSLHDRRSRRTGGRDDDDDEPRERTAQHRGSPRRGGGEYYDPKSGGRGRSEGQRACRHSRSPISRADEQIHRTSKNRRRGGRAAKEDRSRSPRRKRAPPEDRDRRREKSASTSSYNSSSSRRTPPPANEKRKMKNKGRSTTAHSLPAAPAGPQHEEDAKDHDQQRQERPKMNNLVILRPRVEVEDEEKNARGDEGHNHHQVAGKKASQHDSASTLVDVQHRRGTQDLYESSFPTTTSKTRNNLNHEKNYNSGLNMNNSFEDPDLPVLNDDPRPQDRQVNLHKKGRNTESFDPKSTLVRPDLRVFIGNRGEVLKKRLKHDDVVIVPEFFCEEDDWSLYYKLVDEIRKNGQAQQSSDRSSGTTTTSTSTWISWHEGCHLVTKQPEVAPTYQKIVEKICKYFHIKNVKAIGTRFNWYRDSRDWKPFHHDSAAFNPQRAKNQNITVGASFGAERELAFLRVDPAVRDREPVKAYFPQSNGMMFSFGRDANINWKHGINALAEEDQDGKGRISIIVWGNAESVEEEANAPGLLTNDARNGFDNRGQKGSGRGRTNEGGRWGDRGPRNGQQSPGRRDYHYQQRGRGHW
ncbi:unnamed protein product [Amoebophrya sp. A120]|nr:unnamed protein product [Amoebophrya sp. A120]|eukprot:GSA120T00001216001.1